MILFAVNWYRNIIQMHRISTYLNIRVKKLVLCPRMLFHI
jgi:hypothetical protein